MERLVGEGDDMLSKYRHIYGGEEGMQMMRGRRTPLHRPFTVYSRGIDMVVSERPDIGKGTGIA